MDDLGLNCAVCEEYFGNERPPRNLGCGHSVCEFCTTRILSVDKKCPECRQVIKCSNVSEMPINQPLLKLALSLVPGRSQLPQATVLPSAPPLHYTRDEVPSSSRSQADAGECTDHQNRLYFRCMTCKIWICETCLLSNHMSPPQGQCRTLPITQALQEMKKTYMQTSTSKIQFAEKLKRRLEKEITSLDGLREHKSRTTSFLQTILQEIEIIVTKGDGQGKEASRRVSAMQELIDLLKDNKEKVKHATTPDEMKATMGAAEEVLASVEKQILQEQHHHTVRIPLITSLNKQNLRGLLEVVEKGIFVNQCEGSQQRWAKVTERDGLLHLHALQSLVKPPDGVIILPYDTVRNLVPNESPSVFMDIAWGSQTRGRIYVRMFGNTIRGLQALYLCSGEKGPSYKGTCFYKSENLNGPLEILRGGDFENNNGSGGHAILNGITSGGAYKTEITSGLMVGWPVQDYWRLGSFDFYLRDCKGRYDNAAYGIVTNGIENLRSAARHKPVNESMVKDCGLVIPM